VEASPAKVIQYFNGEKQNLIPLFQRPYSWRKSNWQTLWDDILVQYDSDEKLAHFMGTIVSMPAKSVPVGVSKHLIIDGQQRLTTVSILLAALRDTLDEKNSERIQEVYLINKHAADPEDVLKFVPTQVNRDEYKTIILRDEVKVSYGAISEAYDFFVSQLKTSLDLNGDPIDARKVLATLENALQVVMINLSDDDDPYLIFESLNFKGAELTQADLVRNYILMRFRHSVSVGGEQEYIYNTYWLPIEMQLGANLTEFLRHYAMKEGENIYQRGIYVATKIRLKNMVTTKDVETEVQQMKSFASMYSSILNPDQESDPNIRRRLKNLKELDVGTSYPLLLRLLDARHQGFLTVFDLEKCLGLIEAFVVRRAIVGVPTNVLNKIFLQWARQFPAQNHTEWLLASMSSGVGGRRFPGEGEFSEAFKYQRQYGRGYTKWVLMKLEQSFEHKEQVYLANTTIEHIMPQTITEAWVQELGETDAGEVHARYLDTFGNLTLTGYNAELGNLSFSDKKIKLENTHIEITRELLKEEYWGAIQIEKRASRLLDIARSLWSGPQILTQAIVVEKVN
jgi:uncharacterized protein with ParB-like and HNH nuclease domain